MLDKTLVRGFEPGCQAARFGNLCFALSPGFEARSENEWALAILVDESLDKWVKLHQLVVQGAEALNRRGADSAALAQRLLANDQYVLDLFDAERAACLDGNDPRQRCRNHTARTDERQEDALTDRER